MVGARWLQAANACPAGLQRGRPQNAEHPEIDLARAHRPAPLPTQRAAARPHAPQTCARLRDFLRVWCRGTASGQHLAWRRRPRRRPAAAGRPTPARHQRPPRRPATRPPLPRPDPEPDTYCTLKLSALCFQRHRKHPTQTSRVQATRETHWWPTRACLAMTRWHGARPPGSFQTMGAMCCSAAPHTGSITRHDALPA